MSTSSSRAVSMMIGTELVARTRLQTSSPSTFGSIRSSTIRSTSSAVEALERLLAVTRLDDAVPLPLERVREQLLHGLLVVDEEDRCGARHETRILAVRRPCRGAVIVERSARRSTPAGDLSTTIPRPRWPLLPLEARPERRRRAARLDRAARSAVGSTAQPGLSSPSLCSSQPSRSAGLRRFPSPGFPRPSTRRPRLRSHATSRTTSRFGHPGRTARSRRQRWVADRLDDYDLVVERRSFEADVPGRGPVEFVNLIARPPGEAGLSRDAIVVMAHRDNLGLSPGQDDNASGTAALIELARNLSTLIARAHDRLRLRPTAERYGNVGAAALAADPAFTRNVLAVVDLDSLAGDGPPGPRVRGRSPAVAGGRAPRHARTPASSRRPAPGPRTRPPSHSSSTSRSRSASTVSRRFSATVSPR